MKAKSQFVIILLLIFCVNCKKDNITSPTIDYPTEFVVSKGDFVDRINISWVTPPKAKSFEVYRADDINSDYKLIAKTENSNYSDSSNHAVNQKYYYKVRVYNSDNEYSNYTNFDYGFVSKFVAPTLSKNSFGTSNNFITLNWLSVNGGDKYFIFRSVNKVDYSLIDSTDLQSYVDSKNVISGNTFYYKIKAFNKLLGYSDFSDIDSGYVYQSYALIKSFGSFTLASYIDFDSKDNIYIVDATAGKVQMFDKNYNYLKDFISMPGTIFRGIKFIQNDNLLIAESNKGMIGFFDSNGQLIKEKTVSNSTILRQVTTDNSNNIYVADLVNASIVKLNSNGDVIKSWKSTYVDSDFGAYSVFYYNNALLFSSVNGSKLGFCSLDGQLIKNWQGIGATCIAMDNNSNFYFSCFNRIVKTDKSGKILSLIGVNDLQKAQSVNVCENGDLLVTDENRPSDVFIYRQLK